MALRGPEYLPHSKNGISKPQNTTRSSELSTTPMTSEDQATESVPDKEKRTMRSLKKTRKDELLSTASSSSLRNLGQDRQPQRMPSYVPTPATHNSKSKSFLPLTAEDRERDREKIEKLEREAQYSKKWDDHLGFSITLGGKDKSKNKDRFNSSKSLREDRNNTFIPTSREEAEQAGMKVICIKFRVQPAAAGEGDKVVGQDGAFSKTRKYTSTGPSLALVGGMKVKMKSSTGPHVVIDSGVYIGEPPLEDFGGMPGGSSRPTTTTTGTDSVTTSPISHPTGFTWNLFGGIKVDDKERKTTERRKAANDDQGSLPPPSAAAEDFEAPTTVNSLGWKYASAPRLEKGTGSRSTEFGGEVDEAGYAVIIPERSDSISPSLSTTARPTVVVPILTPALAATTPTPAISPKSQPEHETLDQANDNSHSDSSSSISDSSPVFAHSPNESDLDDESFGPGGGAASATSGVSCRPRKGYRYGGYVQAQMKKAKKEGGDERLVIGDRRGVAKAAEVEVNSKLGDARQSQQAKREGKERNKDEEREGWIALDMVNDNGSFEFIYICIYSRILSAFNSILRILHRHSPPYLSSSFTHSHTIINSPNIFTKAKLDPHHRSKDQRVPSDTDDDGQYAATAKNPPTSDGTSHPPILGSLVARAAPAQQLAYVALPYPEWRLNLVNHARRAGMREIGRPLDLALHGWGREFDDAAARERKLQREMEKERRSRRKSEQSHVSTIKARGKRVDRAAGGSDADDDNDEDGDGDEQEAMGATQLDSDSEEESDTEWLAWMTDLPRQFLVQQSHMTVPTSPTSQSSFANPFSSSSLVEGDDEPIRPPRTQEEERTFHADRIRYLEPSSTVRANPTYLPSPTSISFLNSLKQLSSRSSYESLNHQQGSSSRNSTPFPGLSSTDDLLVNKGNHSRSQSRSLQHLGSYRYVGSVPEEGGDGYNPTALSLSQNHGLHHSVSVDQHLSSRRKEVDSHRRYDSITSNENFALGKPILTNEQILQIESEVFTSATNTSLPLHWTLPPIPVPSPSPPPPSASTSKVRLPAVVSTNASGEIKASSSISAINRFTPSDLTRWSTSFGNSLSTPSSPSVPTNSTSPPRTSVLGSLARSPSLLGKIGGQEREKKGFLKKRMSRDLVKDKEKEKDRDTGERAISPAGASPRQRPKLLLPGLPLSTSPYSPTSMPLPNHPEIPFSIHNSNHSSGHQLHQSVSAISSSSRTLRHVHSGTSLRGEEGFISSATGLEVMSPPETEGKEVQKKKKGPIDMIVRGFDSSLAFAEGR